jgi:hypothetical protein
MANITKRDEIQKDLANQIIANKCRVLTNISARVGKIRIVLNYITKPENTVLIVYPEKDIKQAWVDEFPKIGYDSKNIKYSTTMSIKKVDYPVDYLILDEYHKYSDNQIAALVQYINKNNIQKVIGLSGSVAPKTEEIWMKSTGLEVKVNYPIEKAIEDGIIADYIIEVHQIPLDTAPTLKRQSKEKGVYYISEKKAYDNISYLIRMEENYDFPNRTKLKTLRFNRMNLIKKSPTKLAYTKKLLKGKEQERILVFMGLIDTADGLGIPSYHSESKNDDDKNNFLSGKTNHLAIINKLNMGTTFPKLSKSIVSFFDSNPENMFQKINRITCLEYDNPEKKANVIIVTSDEEAEQKWLNSALKFFHPDKIKYV